MQRLATVLIAIGIMAFGAAASPATAQEARREVNVTTDSAPGWIPSPVLEQDAQSAALVYLADIDSGRYAQAHAKLDRLNRQESLADFSARLKAFNAGAGPVKERRVVKVTWTKDPANAPARGVYAAIDLRSRFENIDRHCGYIVLYQRPAGGAFSVMRTEDYLIGNAAAAGLPAGEVDRAWARISANCPDYPAEAAAQAPLPEVEGQPVGYPTVAAALDALRSKQGVTIMTRDGWTIADDSAERTIWSFTPAGNPAHPSAVKRQVEDRNGTASLSMSVQCEASKSACDDLVRSFQALNEQMVQSLKKR